MRCAMYRIDRVFILIQCCFLFFAGSFSQINDHQRDKYIKSIVDYLNNLPNQQYVYEDGTLLSAQKTDENTYAIEANVKANEILDKSKFKLLTCSGSIRDLNNGQISIPENSLQCIENNIQQKETSSSESVNVDTSTDDGDITTVTIQEPVKLDNEVQLDNTVTSGEQFIAVPRVSSHCFGCASHVDPSAPGVQDLALLAVRHLNVHDPTVTHTLTNVVDVERQVQVVNGVRFILTLNIDFDECATTHTAECRSTKACKVSILEKPWVRLHDGTKFRSIVSNNCTDQWLFGDNGEVLPSIPESPQENKNNEVVTNPVSDSQNVPSKETNDQSPTPDYDRIANSGSMDDMLREVHKIDLQAQVPPPQRTLTEQELKTLEEQIIPTYDHAIFSYAVPSYQTPTQSSLVDTEIEKEPLAHRDENTSPNEHKFMEADSDQTSPIFLSSDKRRALDDLLKYFNFGGDVLPKVEFSQQSYQRNYRVKRSNDKLVHIPLSMNDYYRMDTDLNDNYNTSSKKTRIHPSINFVGGPEPKNPYDAKYVQLAEESLQKYHTTSNSQYIHQIVDMVKVTTQVVSGTITKIVFKISPTTCLANGTITFSNEKCKVADPSNVRHCHAEIYDRPWIKGSKEITVNCGKLKKNGSKNIKNILRSKRSIPGGIEEQSPNENAYMKLAAESLQKYQLMSNTPYIHSILQIDRVTTQVVSGLLTNIYFRITPTHCLINDLSNLNGYNCEVQDPKVVLNCHSEIWDRPWLKQDDKKRETNIKCINQDMPKRVKRHVFVGGVKDQDTNSEEYRDLARQSIQKYYALSNTPYVHTLLKIDRVTTQVVNGILTKLYFQIAPTQCLVNDYPNLDGSKCEFQHPDVILNCDSEVWVRPWLKDEKQIVVACNNLDYSGNNVDSPLNSRKKRSIVGDVKEQDPNSREYKDMAYKSLLEYKGFSSSENYHKIIEMKNVTTQVVEGTLTKINFNVVPTSCLKSEQGKPDFDENNCQVYDPSNVYECQAKIWLRSWMQDEKDKKQTEIKCENHDTRSKKTKRSLVDNISVQNPAEQKYKNLAQKSLQKYQLLSNSQIAHKIITVDRVTTQIVAGSLTKIDFTVSPTSCSTNEVSGEVGSNCEVRDGILKCFAEILSRPYLQDENRKEQITINCSDNNNKLLISNRPLPLTGSSDANIVNDRIEINLDNMELVNQLTNMALKHIEAKYPHPRKQKVVRVVKKEKKQVAGTHYRLKLEVAFTNCPAFSDRSDCTLTEEMGSNKFCRVNVWIQSKSDHGPKIRVSCDHQDSDVRDLLLQIQAEYLFGNFIKANKPHYMNNTDEMAKRFLIFKANIGMIHAFNLYEKGTATYGVTRFSDLTYEEFREKHMGLKPSLRDQNQIPMALARIPNIIAPDKFDWRDHGAVTPVKNQGSCGSCWAFSVTGNIEGQWKLKTGNLVSLSEQELVDCDKLDDGCGGGLPDNAYRAIEQLGGLETENEYPYEGEDDKCTFNNTLSKVNIRGAVNITSNETDMVKWLAKNGPISIGINANAMQFYMGGVSHPWKVLCSPNNLDHGVLIVGYGIKEYPLFKKRLPYWIVKNSWGASWGEQGYYRVYRGDGTCGLNQMASSAVV